MRQHIKGSRWRASVSYRAGLGKLMADFGSPLFVEHCAAW
jgi:hypothetical protein